MDHCERQRVPTLQKPIEPLDRPNQRLFPHPLQCAVDGEKVNQGANWSSFLVLVYRSRHPGFREWKYCTELYCIVLGNLLIQHSSWASNGHCQCTWLSELSEDSLSASVSVSETENLFPIHDTNTFTICIPLTITGSASSCPRFFLRNCSLQVFWTVSVNITSTLHLVSNVFTVCLKSILPMKTLLWTSC